MNNINEKKFRYAGEFEPQKAVMICWCGEKYSAKGYNVHDVFVQVIKSLIDEVEVFVNCGIEGSITNCKETLVDAGVDISKIHFTQFEDSLNWSRDYGPDILTDDNGNMRLINFKFNTYQEEEETHEISIAAAKIAPHQAIELGCFDIINSNLISEGGDKEFNGRGVLMTIEDTEVTKRNPLYSKQQVEDEFKQLFNVEKVIWIPQPTFDDENRFDGVLDVVDGENVYRSASANGHIDEMCRFISEDTILLAEISDEEAEQLNSAKITKERLDKAYEILKNATDINGNPFKILRMPCPDPIYVTAEPGDILHDTWCYLWNHQKSIGLVGDTLKDGSQFPTGKIKMQPALSYCNFLIVNGVVLGQSYWKEGLPLSIKRKDEQAKKVLETIFPDRKVITINTTALNILGGGIHCITKNISN
ncbi:agmatine deiminase family protein [Romboutsia weinsteinii]|uniref:Agmatine deiminase family protein n=1 Tax=Romboutsia weinsteinii TaxID=2020949 RepID=A0A371J0S3_9FIRM|nr:agmatine deiminase family protein [Romboutsia weinsteinii]RDY26256.1 agmatine deiminase family protein [Romboutsia weinsteinii]